MGNNQEHLGLYGKLNSEQFFQGSLKGVDAFLGKMNIEKIFMEYQGLNTFTTKTIIDNNKYTIKVDINSSFLDSNYLNFNQIQNLNNLQKDNLIETLELPEYLDSNYIRINKPKQTITGDIDIIGSLEVKNKYITLYNNTPGTTEDFGFKFKGYDTGKNAALLLSKQGTLGFTNEQGEYDLPFIMEPLTSGEVIFASGTHTLRTRKLKPSDIYTEGYEPVDDLDIVTKDYVKKIIDTNLTEEGYKVFNTMDEFNNRPETYNFEGMRAFIIESAYI